MSYCFGGELEMTETIQQLKEDIAVLQEKLQKLEKQQQTKSPVEEAYKDWMGVYTESGKTYHLNISADGDKLKYYWSDETP